MQEKHLGKIDSVYFGIGGYQDAMIGIHFSFSFNSCGIGHSKCTWDANMIKVSKHTKWTEESRSEDYNQIVRYVSELLLHAKVKKVEQLKGIPVEIITENNTFVSFRILTEVL